jgi:predicted enzyme related to lactoylglutathione lyase
MSALPLHGRLVWYELLTSDMKAAETFYGAVAGWTFSRFDGVPFPYDAILPASGQSIGGVMTLPDGMHFPPHWEMYVAVSDFDDAVKQIETRGGHGLSPGMELEGVGKFRTMVDPQGAVFAIIQPASPEQSPEVAPVDGQVAWHELYTTDAPAALAFYSELFGWTDTGSFDMGGAVGSYYMFGRAFPLGGIMTKPDGMAQVPPNWGLYFRVSDINAGAERVKTNGGRILNGPMEVPGGDWIVNCLDPQGAAFSLHQTRKA